MTDNRSPVDSILLVAFGGPTPGCCKERDPCPGEAYCFVHDILGKSPARKKRVEEVAAHYKELGGFSPFNEHSISVPFIVMPTVYHGPLGFNSSLVAS